MIRTVLLAVAAALTLQACATTAPWVDPDADFKQTTDRISTEERDALVAGPDALLAAGDLAGAKVAFEALLAERKATAGENSVVVADTLSAFAVRLDYHDHSAASESYFRRALAAYEAAFGPGHPETAVAWTDLGLILLRIDRAANRDTAVEALTRAYEIREAALGERNAETAYTLLYLAEAYVPRVRPGDPLAASPPDVDKAYSYYQRAAATYPAPPAGKRSDRETILREGMEMLVAYGRPAEAVAYYAPAMEADGPDNFAAALLYERLMEAGYPKEANAVRQRHDRPGAFWPDVFIN